MERSSPQLSERSWRRPVAPTGCGDDRLVYTLCKIFSKDDVDDDDDDDDDNDDDTSNLLHGAPKQELHYEQIAFG